MDHLVANSDWPRDFGLRCRDCCLRALNYLCGHGFALVLSAFSYRRSTLLPRSLAVTLRLRNLLA
jgi:hypothetical protein